MGEQEFRRSKLRTWIDVGLMASWLALSGCVLEPYDGQRVSSTALPVDFSGYLLTPATEVRVYAWSCASSAYEEIGRTASGSTATLFDGEDWYPWELSLPVSPRFWQLGLRGAAARLLAESGPDAGGVGRGTAIVTFAEAPWGCHPARGQRLAGLTDCLAASSPALTICTADYEPTGNRRGECSRRLVKLYPFPAAFTDRLFPAAATVSRAPRQPAEFVELRADRASFVDVFRRSLSDASEEERLHTPGIGYSEFIRLYDPRPLTAESTTRHNLRELAAGFGALSPELRWDGGRSVRFYDRGECSVLITWEHLLEFMSATLEAELQRRLGGIHADSNAELDPILRLGERGDGFHFSHTYAGSVSGASLRISISFTASLRAFDGSPVLTLEDLELVPSNLNWLASLFGGTIEEFITAYRDSVAAQVQDEINRALGGLSIVDVHRIFGRPEGFELVLIENTTDSAFGLISSVCPAVCQRPERTGSPTFLGYFDALFDPPSRGERPFIVERDLPSLRIRRTDSGFTADVVVGGAVACRTGS